MIETLTERCWHVLYPGDRAAIDDGEAHFDSDPSDWLGMDGGHLGVAQFPEPCHTVKCDTCSELLIDDDHGWVVHFPDAEQARQLADTAYGDVCEVCGNKRSTTERKEASR